MKQAPFKFYIYYLLRTRAYVEFININTANGKNENSL